MALSSRSVIASVFLDEVPGSAARRILIQDAEHRKIRSDALTISQRSLPPETNVRAGTGRDMDVFLDDGGPGGDRHLFQPHPAAPRHAFGRLPLERRTLRPT